MKKIIYSVRMKKIIYTILTWLAISIAFYLVFAFISFDLDASKWDSLGRFLYVVFSQTIGIGVAISVYDGIKGTKKTK